MARLIPADPGALCLDGIKPAELETLVYLRDHLADDLLVFHGIHWTRERSGWCLFGEMDFVVVNPLGHLLVIEQKDGAVEEGGGQLTKQCGAGAKDIIERLRRSVDIRREKSGALRPKAKRGPRELTRKPPSSSATPHRACTPRSATCIDSQQHATDGHIPGVIQPIAAAG